MILVQCSLRGQAAVVTGAATGLGAAIAAGLAQAGADVAGVYHSHAPDALRAQVEGLGRRFAGIRADLAAPGAPAAIIGQAVSELGRVDILINNAGITRRVPALELTEQDWDDVLDVNLKALFFLCQAAARQMRRQGDGGAIVNIASMLSYQGGIRVAPYTASKSGVLGLTRILANEWAPHGIRVNGIAPGYMATELTASLQADPGRNAEILARIPAGRWGAPEDLQGAAVFLASRASAYMNGFVSAVDGGWLAR